MTVQELRTKIEALSALRKQAELVGHLAVHETRVAETSARARSVDQQYQASLRVFEKVGATSEVAGLSTVLESRQNASRLALKVAKRQSQDVAKIRTESTERDLTNLHDAIRAAETRLRAKWKTYIDEFLNSYQQLAGALKQAHLVGAENIDRALTSLREVSGQPPGDDGQADRLAAEILKVRKGIEALGVDNVIGAFLVAAASGSADARQLDLPQVRTFVDGAGLWQLLRVRLI